MQILTEQVQRTFVASAVGEHAFVRRRVGNFHAYLRTQSVDDPSCGETVYIAQLHRRALILNHAFQQKVMDGLAQTMTGIAVG